MLFHDNWFWIFDFEMKKPVRLCTLSSLLTLTCVCVCATIDFIQIFSFSSSMFYYYFHSFFFPIQNNTSVLLSCRLKWFFFSCWLSNKCKYLWWKFDFSSFFVFQMLFNPKAWNCLSPIFSWIIKYHKKCIYVVVVFFNFYI